MAKSISFAVIKEIIGEDLASKIIELYADSNVYIPKNVPEFPDNDTRNRYIRNLYSSGKTADELSEQFQLSKSHIYKIINLKATHTE